MLKNKKYILGNWKMSFNKLGEAKKQIDLIKKQSGRLKNTVVVIAPSFPHIAPLFSKSVKLNFAGQDCSLKDGGAYTGEVSAKMLKDLGCGFVIVGHSERRAMGETNEVVAEKVGTALTARIKPIICIGESERDDGGKYLNVLRDQLFASMVKVQRGDLLDIIIAYEPVFAIGASKAMATEEIHQTVLYLRKLLAEKYGKDLAQSILIVYGGTVNKENASGILNTGVVDGLLVGRVSTTPELVDLLKVVDKI